MLLSFNAKRKVYKTFKSRSLHPSVGEVSKLVRSFTSILGLLPLLPTLSLLIGLQLFSSPVPLFKLMALIIINQKHKETDQIVLHPSEMVLLEQKFLILNMPSENAWVGADRRRRLSVRAAGQTISPEVDIRGYTRPHSTVTPTIRQNTKEEETILTVTLFLREIIQ